MTADKTQLYVRERVQTTKFLTRDGRSAPEIAVRLGVTARTVARYRARIRQQTA
jgi:DNA-binding CsgD family transcriptional regulator